MTYKVMRFKDIAQITDPADDAHAVEQVFNSLESDGWTLVQIIQGFQDFDNDDNTLAYVRPEFIFHRD